MTSQDRAEAEEMTAIREMTGQKVQFEPSGPEFELQPDNKIGPMTDDADGDAVAEARLHERRASEERARTGVWTALSSNSLATYRRAIAAVTRAEGAAEQRAEVERLREALEEADAGFLAIAVALSDEIAVEPTTVEGLLKLNALAIRAALTDGAGAAEVAESDLCTCEHSRAHHSPARDGRCVMGLPETDPAPRCPCRRFILATDGAETTCATCGREAIKHNCTAGYPCSEGAQHHAFVPADGPTAPAPGQGAE